MVGNGVAAVLTTVALGGGGGIGTLFSAGGGDEVARQEVVQPHGSLEPWEELSESECDFQPADAAPAPSDLCAPFAIARFAGLASQRVTDRALTCAARYDTDCLLSTEVGLALPAAFVYDQQKGVRMLVAPRLLPLPPQHNSTVRRVRVHHPTDPNAARVVEFNDTISAEFLVGGTGVLVTETLKDGDAFCVQLLRRAYDKSCWSALE